MYRVGQGLQLSAAQNGSILYQSFKLPDLFTGLLFFMLAVFTLEKHPI